MKKNFQNLDSSRINKNRIYIQNEKPPKLDHQTGMPYILHGAAKKIRNTISRQVSGLAQLPDDLKFIVDQESNT